MRTFFLQNARKTIKTLTNDDKHRIQTAPKLKWVLSVLKSWNNFEKNKDKKKERNKLKSTPSAHHRHNITSTHLKKQKYKAKEHQNPSEAPLFKCHFSRYLELCELCSFRSFAIIASCDYFKNYIILEVYTHE